VRRTVFYLPGFDPRGAKFYHRLYREQAEKQQSVNGLAINVGKRGRIDNAEHQWRVSARDMDGGNADVDYHYLAWDDIVRMHWVKSPVSVLLGAFRAFKVFVLSGGVVRGARLNRYTVITLLYPILFIFFSLILIILLSLATLLVVPEAYRFGSVIPIALLWYFGYPFLVRIGDRINAFWLLRIYLFIDVWVHIGDVKLESRLDQFAERIAGKLSNSAGEEVVIIGHSVGAILLVPVLARLNQRGVDLTRLSIITLGHCIPLILELRGASSYESAVKAVAATEGLDWYDFSAARDGASFFGLSPLYRPERAGEARSSVKCYSARFHTLFSQSDYENLRKDWYRMHFQYLMAADRPGLMDYFRFTASPQRIPEQFKTASDRPLIKSS